MDFWFTLIVCVAWLSLLHAQSAGQDGSENDKYNKLEQLISQQAQDLASVKTEMKTLTMNSRQEERMAEIEIRNIEKH